MAALTVLGVLGFGCADEPDSVLASCAAPDVVYGNSEDEGFSELHVVRGDDVELLVPDWVAGEPSFSPDGEELVVVRAIGDYESAGPGATELWRVPLDGGEPRQLTSGNRAHDSDWSASNDRIAYIEGAGELFTIRSDGTDRQSLASPSSSTRLNSPRWSPDGSQIAFLESTPSDDSRETVVQIAAAIDGEVEATFEAPDASSLSWAPDGDTLFVSTYALERGTVLQLDTASGSFEELADDATLATAAADGRSIYFWTKEGAANEALWRVARGHVEDGQLVVDQLISDDSLYGYGYYGMATPACQADT